MRKLKLGICFALTFLLVSCTQKPISFPLSQSRDQIIAIELLEDENQVTDPQNFVVRCVIPESDYETFLAELAQLDCSRNGFEPATSFGWWIIRIIYSNGDMDLIGSQNNAQVIGGKKRYDCYCFHYESFRELISKWGGIVVHTDK